MSPQPGETRNTPERLCPQCQTGLSQVGNFWICPNHGLIPQTPPEPNAPPRGDLQSVFISYGWEDAESFARRLADDLKANGCGLVFFDRESIRKASNFDVKIEHGIRDTVVFAAVLTPYSVRDDSICRNETVIAHNENKQIVPLRVNNNPKLPIPLLLVRRNWIDFSANYENGLSALVRFLQGDQSGLLPPALGTISGVVPIDFAPEIARFSADFTGREWLRSEVDGWISTGGARAMIILAEPGFGKSAIAAWISQQWPNVVGIHFCTQGNSRTRDPHEFVANLVGQLHGRLPGFGDAVAAREPEKRRKTASDSFRELIVEVLRSPFPVPDHPCLIVVDSLDESLAQADETILDVLIEHAADLPPWLRLIATSRPEEEVLKRVRTLSVLELNCERPDNLADIRAYISARLAAGPPSALTGAAHRIGEQLVTLSAGNFLYAKMALDALSDGAMTEEDLNQLAPGVVRFFFEMFRRRFSDSDLFQRIYAPILRALVAARAPLPFSLLGEVTGEEAETVLRRLRALRSYLRVSGRGETAIYSVFHRSLTDWLADPDAAGGYWCRPLRGHEALAGVGWRLYEAHSLAGNDYFVRYLSDHLAGSEQWERLTQFLTDFTVLNAIYEQHRTHEWMRLWRRLMDRTNPALAYRAALERLKLSGVPGPRLAHAAEQVGGLLRDLGLFTDAVGFSEEAVAAWEMVAGADAASDELAGSLRNLAEAWRLLKEFDKALPCYERALKIWKRLHGEQSAQAATIFHDFAEFYRDQSAYPKAIDYNQRAMKIREALIPLDLAALADCVNDTGVLLWEHGKAKEALAYYERALALFRQAYPSGEHYDIAAVLHNIANLRSESGDEDKHRSLLEHERALEMVLMFRPFYHPQARTVRAGIVSDCLALGLYERAIKFQRESVRCADVLAATGTTGNLEQMAEKVTQRTVLVHLLQSAGMTAEAERLQPEIHRETVALANLAMTAGKESSTPIDGSSLRTLAFQCFRERDYANAERILRYLITRNFETPGTHVHLARILLLQGLDQEAGAEIEAAWQSRSEAPPYTLQRILLLRILLARLFGEPAEERIRELKTELAGNAHAVVWDVDSLLEHVRPRLSDTDNELLAVLVAAINNLEARAGLATDPEAN